MGDNGGYLALRSLENEPQLDIDTVVKTMTDLQDRRQKAEDSKRDYDEKVADLDIKAQYWGIGRVLPNAQGRIMVQPYQPGQAPNVPPSGMSSLAYGLAQQGLDPDTIQATLDGLNNNNVAPKDRAARTRQMYQMDRDTMDRGMKLRDKLAADPRMEQYRDLDPLIASARNTLNAVESGEVDNFIAIDNTLSKALARATDPRTGVREFEEAQLLGGQSFVDRMKGYQQKLASGGQGLTLSSRKAIVDELELLGNVYAERYNKALDETAEAGKTFRVPKELVIAGHKKATGYGNNFLSEEAAMEAIKSGRVKPGSKIKIKGKTATVGKRA